MAKRSPTEREVRIHSLARAGEECVVHLEEVDGIRLLPIWIGMAEAQAIAIRFSDIVVTRPLTHDLLLNTIQTLGYTVVKVVVHDLVENTFLALIHIHRGRSDLELDARPSDALALAVRAGCPIYVEESVFARGRTVAKPITEEEAARFKADLENIKPEDIIRDLGETGPPEEEPPEYA